MTELELIELGFKCEKEYTHDQYHTNRYVSGVLSIEFTYEDDELKSVDLTISEVNSKPITLAEMKVLTPILGSWNE